VPSVVDDFEDADDADEETELRRFVDVLFDRSLTFGA
jgi:hypothetical protein